MKRSEQSLLGRISLHYEETSSIFADVLSYPIKTSAKIYRQTVLHFAVQTNNLDNVKLLIKYGANPNMKRYKVVATPHSLLNKQIKAALAQQVTPLQLALGLPAKDIFLYLLQQNTTFITQVNWERALNIAVANAKECLPAIYKRALKLSYNLAALPCQFN